MKDFFAMLIITLAVISALFISLAIEADNYAEYIIKSPQEQSIGEK